MDYEFPSASAAKPCSHSDVCCSLNGGSSTRFAAGGVNRKTCTASSVRERQSSRDRNLGHIRAHFYAVWQCDFLRVCAKFPANNRERPQRNVDRESPY